MIHPSSRRTTVSGILGSAFGQAAQEAEEGIGWPEGNADVDHRVDAGEGNGRQEALGQAAARERQNRKRVRTLSEPDRARAAAAVRTPRRPSGSVRGERDVLSLAGVGQRSAQVAAAQVRSYPHIGHLSPRDATLVRLIGSRNMGWEARQLPSTLVSSTRSKLRC